MAIPDKSLLLFNELHNTVTHIGIENTLQVLYKARNENLIVSTIHFVFYTVSETIGISMDQLQNSKMLCDERKAAIGICFFFLRSKYSTRELINNMGAAVKIQFQKRSIIYYYNVVKNAKIDKPKSNIDQIISNTLPKIREKLYNAQLFNPNGNSNK